MPTDAFLERLDVDTLLEAPPMNNACIPDIFSKIDADTIEKTRVVNAVLEFRLQVQEKMISKYRLQAEKTCRKEKEKIYKELRRIHRKLPYMGENPHQDTREKVREFRMAQNHIRTPLGYTTVPKEIPGLTEEKDNRPFCQRYHSHHLPTKSKWFQDILNKSKPRYPTIATESEIFSQSRSKDKSRSFLISRGLSASENCLVAGSTPIFREDRLGHLKDNDDAMTI